MATTAFVLQSHHRGSAAFLSFWLRYFAVFARCAHVEALHGAVSGQILYPVDKELVEAELLQHKQWQVAFGITRAWTPQRRPAGRDVMEPPELVEMIARGALLGLKSLALPSRRFLLLLLLPITSHCQPPNFQMQRPVEALGSC